MYALLFSDQNPKHNWANNAWEQDLAITLSDTDWETMYTNFHKGSLNIYAQENAFKLLSRWYRTPLKLHHIYPAISPHCWRCGIEIGSLLHIWWTYPKLQPFWKEVHRLIHQITTYKLDYTPAQYLLRHPSLPKHTYFRSLAMHMVNAAKMCIPNKWRSSEPPSLVDWFQRINKTAELEDLIHQAKATPSKFTQIWSCWLHFKTTDEYQRILT